MRGEDELSYESEEEESKDTLTRITKPAETVTLNLESVILIENKL